MGKLRSTLVLEKRLHAGLTTPRQYLTGLDIFHTHANFPLVLIFKNGLDLALVERALVETLRHYPLVAGRYKKDEHGQVFVDGNDAGIDFRVHRCEGSMPFGLHNPLGKRVNQLVKLVMPWQMVEKDAPFVQINIHQYEDNGVVLCCYVPHSLFDGASFWGFMLDWSKACRGLEIQPSSFDRTVLIEAGKRPVDASHDLMHSPSMSRLFALFAKLGWRAVTDMSREVFRIPAETVQQWKDEAKAELPGSDGLSTGSLVAAYAMKAISPVLPGGVGRSVGLVLDLRYKRHLGVPRNYFGNALCYAEARYGEQELVLNSVPVLAEKCRPAPDEISTASLFKMLAKMELHRQKKSVWRLLFRPTVETLKGGLILNNCVQLPIYDIDLGNGTPDWFEMLPATIRMLLVVQTPQKDGGVDLHLSARKAELTALRAQLVADGINLASVG